MQELNKIENKILFSKRFITGLKKRNINYDEINNWYYCGGEDGSHLNYYKLIHNNSELPEHQTHCICGHKIKHNYYIKNNNDDIIVMGNSCIKKFFNFQSMRSCEECGIRHRNRKDNKCNRCRKKFTKKYVDNIVYFD